MWNKKMYDEVLLELEAMVMCQIFLYHHHRKRKTLNEIIKVNKDFVIGTRLCCHLRRYYPNLKGITDYGVKNLGMDEIMSFYIPNDPFAPRMTNEQYAKRRITRVITSSYKN